MSRIGTIASLMSRLPTVLRTLRHIRSDQARAQIHHMVSGLPAPAQLTESAPQLAVEAVSTKFIGPAPHVNVCVDGEIAKITLLGLGLDLDLQAIGIAWSTQKHGPLFAYHLHEQTYLRHEALLPEQRAAIINDWIAQHDHGVGWDPHPISLRLLNWGKLLLGEGMIPESVKEAMLGSMADQAETLSQGLEVRLQANHLLSNLLGVVFAGMLFEGSRADKWLERTALFEAELSAQVHADGGHEERSPMYHSLLLEGLLDLLNLAKVSPRAPSGLAEALRTTASRMVAALGFYTAPDGRISLFADSAWGVAADPGALVEYASSLGISFESSRSGIKALEDSGYVRLQQDDFDAIVSTSGPRPAHQPGHAHCDALAFELSVAGERLVTDTGVFEYQAGPRRQLARSTSSHATLVFDGEEQSELWSAHRVGGRAKCEPARVEASGDVWVSTQGWVADAPQHDRCFRVDDGAFEVIDRVIGASASVVSSLPIAPGWSLTPLEGGMIARKMSEQSGPLVVQIDLPKGFDWTIERAPFYPTFHEEVERDVLVGRGQTPLDCVIRFKRIEES